MKQFYLTFILVLSTLFVVQAQHITGTYKQETCMAPKKCKLSENNLFISKDSKSSKKIWINNLLPEKFYAIIHTNGDESLIYSIPKQVLSNYTIGMGCVIFDKEDEKIIISLNNKSDCFGMSSDDLSGEISVGKDGVKAGSVKVGSDGTIKVNTKEALEGIQYIGYKQ